MILKYGPYSPSRLDTGVCGYAFHKQYIDPAAKARPKTENIPQARGSAVHEIFETITTRMIKNPSAVFSGEEVRQLVVEAVNRHPAAYQEIDAILHMARLYIEKPPATLVEDAGVELRLAVKLEQSPTGPQFIPCDYNDPQAFVRGRADILMISDDTTKALVYDHKTQPNVEEADTFQLGIYAWVIWKTHPFLDEIHTILHFARYGIYSQPVTWTKEMLMAIEDELITRVAVIENRTDWGATPHDKCQYCPLLVECPALKEFIDVDQNTGAVRVQMNNLKILGDTMKAVKLAGLLNVLEETVKQIKGEIRNHVKLSGTDIAIPGKIYGYVADEGIDWDKVNTKLREQAFAVFKKHDVDPVMFMGFSQTFSKSVWLLENEQLLKELAALFPRKASSEFKGRKG